MVSVIFASIACKPVSRGDTPVPATDIDGGPYYHVLTVAKGSLPLAWQHAASQRAPLMRDRGKCQFVPNSAAGIPLEKTSV